MRKVCIALILFVLSAVALADLPNPIAWFNMREMSGGVIEDASGNGRALSLGSSVRVVDDPLVGKALKVTGLATDYATFSCPVVTNTTIAFWINRDATDGSIMEGGSEKNTMPYIMSTGYSGFGINYKRNTDEISLVDQQNSPQTSFLAQAQRASNGIMSRLRLSMPTMGASAHLLFTPTWTECSSKLP